MSPALRKGRAHQEHSPSPHSKGVHLGLGWESRAVVTRIESSPVLPETRVLQQSTVRGTYSEERVRYRHFGG
jgi:hypothetical protein